MRSHSPGNLVYRVCLVTHATGTGLAAARYLHRQGAQVILTDSDPDDLEITARQLGSRIPAIACDLSTIAGIESLIQQIDDRYGYLDLVHTSIEMTHRHDPYALDEQDFDLYVNATLKSTYFLVTRSLELLNDEASVTLAAHSCCVRDPLCSLTQAAIDAFAVSLGSARHLRDRGIGISVLTCASLSLAARSRMRWQRLEAEARPPKLTSDG
ncbi:SDR family oxidoreductase [Streptomyces sp. NPDC127159]|uniref:Uncharacterized protein n=1 Tax=Streptomyces lannensis TaxID=766498 RepID=A0ABP7LR59_9ACTN